MMHRYLCLFLIVAVAGCSSPAAHLVGKSPAMAALCAKPDDIQGTIDAAQEHCEEYGKSAELIGSAAGVQRRRRARWQDRAFPVREGLNF